MYNIKTFFLGLFFPRDLFNATGKLLKQENEGLFPLFKVRLQLANEMGVFFVNKVCDIYSKLDKMTEELPSGDSVSLVSSSESVATMETTYRKQCTRSSSQLCEENVHVRSHFNTSCCELPRCVTSGPDKNHKHIYNV